MVMQETMRDAAVERLAKIISDRRPDGEDNGKNAHPRKPLFRIHIGLDEGWFSLFLLATVVYSTIWCVQAAAWVDHLNILSLTTLLGLVGGVVAAKQRRFPRLAVHLVAIILGLLLAFWQTAGAYYAGNTAALVNGVQQWFVSVMAGGTGENDSIFLFFITALGFLLAYTSAWLVYRTRSPWLMIVANAVVLLINLSYIESGYIVFLVVFLMASLLLLLRFNLYESVKRWRRQGLRYADDLGWDVMQAGALLSIGILIFSWFLPFGYTNDTLSQVWNANANPWVQLEDTWNRVISLSGGANLSNHGNFRDMLALGGNPNLNNDIVFTVDSNDPNQYLEAVSYDTYDGRGWSIGPTSGTSLQANEVIPAESAVVHPVVQRINVVDPPGEQDQYLFGAPQIGLVGQPSVMLDSNANNSLIAVLSKNGKLVAGEQYSITSYVSSADANTLRTVPMPADSQHFPANYDGPIPPTYYDPSVLATYTRLPTGLDLTINALALRITSDKPTMYDKVQALEEYFHDNFTYDVNISLPPGEEGVSWFLFHSDHRGFCNYFATAMAVMARTLGIPARVVVGYTNGHYDVKSHQWVIRGSDAHAWTQVYFAGYGWVNFEPSAGFNTFARPAPGQFQSIGSSSPPNGGGSNTKPPTKPIIKHDESTGTSGSLSTQSGQEEVWGQRVGLTLGSVILLFLFCLVFFTIWWRRLFRGYRLSAQIYGRIGLLANWAGIPIPRSQTPYEYINGLAVVNPDEAETLERFGDIYVRELWADPDSPEHPRSSGEVKELPGLWQRLQPRLFLYLARHPYVLRKLPAHVWGFLNSLRIHRGTLHDFEEDL
jgi:Transglutaminase-like superfamily/TgpA N-terminal domain